MITCQKAGCGLPATHAMQICAGTFTDPDDAPPRVKILANILVCEDHLDEADAGALLAADPTWGQIITVAMSGGPPPDLGRARILGVRLDSDEYRELQITALDHRRH